MVELRVCAATLADLGPIRSIYNEGIEDRVATLDESLKSERDIADWFAAHGGRYAVLVAQRGDAIVGWASLNRYSHRCAYDGVADLSVYVARSARGTGVGTALLAELERVARFNAFRKIVLFALANNAAGIALYTKLGYREVGILREQGVLDGVLADVIVMERIVGRS
jgi:L-amino acid N-acyltransferase YncA